MTLTKFIYDDRDPNSQGWFLRQYIGNEEVSERVIDSYLDSDAKIDELISEAELDASLTDKWELYRSISDSLPAETIGE